MGSLIVGSGVAVPPRVVTNDDLSKIMDTTDEWIVSRSGVRQRHVAEPGVGPSDLAAEAVTAALADAGVAASEVDLLVTATMTPDQFAPGIAGEVQDRSGLGHVGAFDLRQQCGGFLYGLDMADAMLSSGKAECAVVVGAEVHAGYMPYGDSWDILRGLRDDPPSPEDYAAATEARAWAVLFGDGAGAVVLRRNDDPTTGLLDSVLRTDGSHADLIQVPGVGFRHQPYVDASQIGDQAHWPTMNGMELFRQAVTCMPAAVHEVLEHTGYELSDVSLVIAHQANDRILDGVRKQLGVSEEVAPSNIARYGNTTAATLPILFHEQHAAGNISVGDLVCFTAFGAGAHWGASLYRAA